MSKLQEIQIIRKVLEKHLSQIDGKCSFYSTSKLRSIQQIDEMHESLLRKSEDVLLELHTQYPNSEVLIAEIKKMAENVRQVYPWENVYGTNQVVEIKKWDFFHPYIDDEDIFKKRKSFFAFKSDLLILLSEYAKAQKSTKKTPGTPRNRHEALIYYYKAKYGYIDKIASPKEIESELGPKRKQAMYTIDIWLKGKKYKAPTKAELETLIPYLSTFPNAQKAAINDLDKIM